MVSFGNKVHIQWIKSTIWPSQCNRCCFTTLYSSLYQCHVCTGVFVCIIYLLLECIIERLIGTMALQYIKQTTGAGYMKDVATPSMNTWPGVNYHTSRWVLSWRVCLAHVMWFCSCQGTIMTSDWLMSRSWWMAAWLAHVNPVIVHQHLDVETPSLNSSGIKVLTERWPDVTPPGLSGISRYKPVFFKLQAGASA